VTATRWWLLPAAVVATALLLSGCSALGGKKAAAVSTSVFDVKPGQCFNAPTEVKSELSSISRTPCTSPHTQEAYAIVTYAPGGGVTSAGAVSAPSAAGASGSAASGTAFPGEDVLTSYAQGVCAQQFTGYIGVDYLDSKLFFTYLLPSARGWEQADDRNIICFVTTTGASLTTSVKGSKQ
jgi:Septum formation